MIKLLILLLPLNALAYDPSPPHPNEIQFLPPYCKYKLASDATSPGALYWIRVMEGAFSHVHHYCWGLTFVSRANKTFGNESDRMILLNEAVGNFQYVIDNQAKNSKLAPEIYTEKGKALASMNKMGEALQSFNTAIALNPKYVGSYLALADLYQKMGNLAEAKKIIQRGLMQLPGSKGLQQRLQKLS